MLSETLTILLVEDSSTDTCLVQERLGDVEAFQFQLIHVSRLAEALACLTAQKSISVILLDLSLPDAQGLDAVTQVLLVSPDIPIVVMSSLSDEAIALQALQKGAQDYLVKAHTDGHLLVRSMRYAIERQRMQQRLQQAKTELRQRAEREALVNRIALALNCERDPQRVLDEIVRQLAVPMNCDCCMVVRALPELNSISVEAEYWPNFAKGVTLQTPIPVTTDWQKVREVLQQNQPIAITTDKAKEQEEEPLYLGKEESFLQILHHPLSPVFQSLPPEQRPMAMLLTPIFVREQYYGHLLVAYLQPRLPFSEGEIHFLQQLATQTALVLQNARQLKHLEQLVQQRTQQLAQEKTLLEAIVNSIQEGICVIQPDGQIVLMNPAAWQILGLEPEAMTGSLQEWLDNVQICEPDGSVPTFEQLPISRTLQGEVVRDYELVVRCANGEQKWISVNGATVCVSVAGGDAAGGSLQEPLPYPFAEHLNASASRVPNANGNGFGERGMCWRSRVPQAQSDNRVHRAANVQLAINTTRDITERKRAEDALVKHDRLLNGVAAAMTQLLVTSGYQTALKRSLAVLSEAADVDRVYIFENHVNENTGECLTRQRFEWGRDPVVVQDNLELPHLAYDVLLPRWHPRLQAGQSIKGLVRDFPQVEREILEPHNIRSILVVPVMMEETFWGFILFADCQSDRQWTDYEESLLTLIAGSIGGTLIRQHRSQALRESEAKFRTLYESTSTAVMLLDENGIFDANSAALQMFGCTQCEQLGGFATVQDGEKNYHPLGFSPSVQPNGQESWSLAQDYIATAISEGSCRFDWIYHKQNGEDFPAEVTLTAIELGNRKVLQAAIYDLGDRKATEKQLLQAKEAAEAGSRAKSEFLATISHELRTPLNAVLGLSQLMGQEIFGTLNEKQKEYVNCIQSSGEHLLSLINDILDLSKVEAGKEQLCFVPLDIQDVCEYCLAMVREQAYDRGLELNLDIEPQAKICIADERRCKQMLLNLLSNAVKFTLAGKVSLIVRKLPEGICFTVEDTGIGIAAEKLPLLFEPFRQLDSGLNRQFAGTGLGLALTRSLARLHGGNVTVKSTLGQGSQFTLCLPDWSSEELFLPSSSQEAGIYEGQSCPLGANSRILLVENDERSALLLKDYLQVIGHRVEHLTDSTNFLDSVRHFKPDLILMDVQLQGQYTGFDLLAALHREPDTKHLKVVMVTAMAMAGDRERCLEAGADEYLSKPIGIAQLEAILMRYL